MSRGRRESTQSKVELAQRKWVGRCNKKLVDPFSYGITSVLNFLGELFEAGYEYKATGTHRHILCNAPFFYLAYTI